MAKKSRKDETSRATNGQMMTIIAYRSANDIDVQFEDNTIVTNKKYVHFQRGKIANPNFKPHKGETSIANNGQMMTIIAYRGNTDIDVQFEDKTIVTNKSYDSFLKGYIANPNLKKERLESYNGETNMATNGQIMTIIAYRGANDIDVQFEDKTIVTNKSYNSFLKGHIANPNLEKEKLESYNGETNMATNGQMMTIIAYRGAFDIDVQFEDETIVTNKEYAHFQKGKIANPNFKPHKGETSIATNGQMMTIIAYRGYTDIDIQFEDNTIVTNKKYDSFLKGYIANPNCLFKNGISFPEFILSYYLEPFGFKKYAKGYFKKYDKNFGLRELDGFNKKLMIGFEYDGAYWHQDQEKDLYKNKLCKLSNIDLIRVREPGLESLNSSSYDIILEDLSYSSLTKAILSIISYINNKYSMNIDIDVDVERDLNDIRLSWNEKYLSTTHCLKAKGLV